MALKLRYWKDPAMKRTAITAAVALAALSAAACGQTIEQRAATGAVAGAAVGQAEKPN